MRAWTAALAGLGLVLWGAPAGAEVREVALAWAAERTPDGQAAHDGEIVRVRGTVTTAGDAYYDDVQKVFIQDDEAGLCLFTRQPETRVEPGDRVEAEGRIQVYAGLVQLAISRLAVVGKGPPPAPVDVPAEELMTHRYTGRLVRTSGVVARVTERSTGLGATLAAGENGVVVVYLTNKQAGTFNREPFREGSSVRVQGIASQFDRELPFQGGWQLLPRVDGDVELLRPPPLFTAGDVRLGLAGAALLLLAAVGWNVALHRRVRARTAEYRRAAETLAEANRHLEQAIKLRDEVVAIVAHDFRSPLTLVQGYADTLRAAIADPEQARMLDVISRQSQYLAALAADTLTMSRLESSTLPFEFRDVDLAALVRSVASARSQEPGRVLLEVPTSPLSVRGDPERLHEMLANVIDNALKYSNPGSTVAVWAGRAASGVGVSVSNEGLAISPEEMPRLFQKFSRLDSARARHIPGTGLGLYICRCIVEAHGGRIWADSDERGTTFHVHLPDHRAGTAESPASS